MKQITIEIPDNMEFDKETMTIREIKTPNYNKVTEKLFKNKNAYFIDTCGNICEYSVIRECYSFPNNCTSVMQAKKLLAINQLMNVAKYLNNGWKPSWSNSIERKWFIYIDGNNITYSYNSTLICSPVYFKNEELAIQAVEILGEEIIRLALSTDW